MTTDDDGCRCGTAALAAPSTAIEPCACGCEQSTPEKRPSEKAAADLDEQRTSAESKPVQR